jgi:hypothetical protein
MHKLNANTYSWEERVRLFLKAEIARADITYGELALRLQKYGLSESAASISNKLRRGTFSATFFLAAVAALDIETIKLDDLMSHSTQSYPSREDLGA